MVAAVRSFNRTVAQRVGALTGRHLNRGRPDGEARVLSEIGTSGIDVRTLRGRLRLDSAYVSRLLRSLEAAGLVGLAPNEADRRVRTAQLTPKGRAELAAMDRRGDELARSTLSALTPTQGRRLVAAMAEVERLLTAAAVDISQVDPDDPSAQRCLTAYYAELDRRFATGFDPMAGGPVISDEMRPPSGLFLVATLGDAPVGSGVLRFHGDGSTEIKRLWVAMDVRGLGLGRRLLSELEDRAVRHGSDTVRLDTNRSLEEAIAMYRRGGYREVAAFNDNPYADHWFEKHLDPPGAQGRPG